MAGAHDPDEGVAGQGVADGGMDQMARFRQPGAAAIVFMNTLVPTEGDCPPGGLGRLFRGWPESRGRLIDQRRQESDVSRDRGLADIEDLRPDFLGDVIAGVSASHDQCLTEGKPPWAAFSLVPWFFEQFGYAFLSPFHPVRDGFVTVW